MNSTQAFILLRVIAAAAAMFLVRCACWHRVLAGAITATCALGFSTVAGEEPGSSWDSAQIDVLKKDDNELRVRLVLKDKETGAVLRLGIETSMPEVPQSSDVIAQLRKHFKRVKSAVVARPEMPAQYVAADGWKTYEGILYEDVASEIHVHKSKELSLVKLAEFIDAKIAEPGVDAGFRRDLLAAKELIRSSDNELLLPGFRVFPMNDIACEKGASVAYLFDHEGVVQSVFQARGDVRQYFSCRVRIEDLPLSLTISQIPDHIKEGLRMVVAEDIQKSSYTIRLNAPPMYGVIPGHSQQDGIFVAQLVRGTSATEANVEPKSKILEVNGTSTVGMSLADFHQFAAGLTGAAKFTFLSPGGRISDVILRKKAPSIKVDVPLLNER